MFHGQFFDCFSQLEAAWARLFYFSGWESPHIHFCVEHVWTRCPGWSMRKCDKPAVQGQACRQCVSLTYSISNIWQHIDKFIDSRYFEYHLLCAKFGLRFKWQLNPQKTWQKIIGRSSDRLPVVPGFKLPRAGHHGRWWRVDVPLRMRCSVEFVLNDGGHSGLASSKC